MWSCNRVDPTDTIPRERRAFDGIRAMPEELFFTRTGADGTYRIDGLPREAEFLCLIDPGPEYHSMSETIATTTKAVPNVRGLGYEGVLDHTFAAPREVRLAVRYSDTNLPACNATVRAKTNREMLRAGSVGETDDSGAHDATAPSRSVRARDRAPDRRPLSSRPGVGDDWRGGGRGCRRPEA